MRRWRRRASDSVPDVDQDWERKSAQIREAAALRQAELAGQGATVAVLEELLFRHDPIGINFEDNTDEYRAEAETITLRRPEASSVEDVQRITHEEFVRWFDVHTAGPEDRYEAIAQEIWQLWSGEPC